MPESRRCGWCGITGADVYRLPPHSLIAQDNEVAVIVG